MKQTTLSIYFIFFVLLSAFFLHEVTHIVILEYYGITEYDIVFGFGYVGVSYYGECSEICLLAHSINEVVFYNIIPLLILILYGMIILTINQNKK